MIFLFSIGYRTGQFVADGSVEANVYTEIVPFNTPLEKNQSRSPKRPSGGPASVYEVGRSHPGFLISMFRCWGFVMECS